MDSRRRFHETMKYGSPDRVPYFEEGIRDEVRQAWSGQGLSATDLYERFPTDRREEIQLDLDPHPDIKKWPTSNRQLEKFAKSFRPDDRKRYPKDWPQQIRSWQNRDHLLMLRVHRGFFNSMGVQGWQRFSDAMLLLAQDPDLVREIMMIKGEFTARLAEKVLKDVEVDAAVFSEPAGGNDGPLISPQTYENVVLKSYQPVFDVLRKYGVGTIIFRTYANARRYLPMILNGGFNCLWACEVNIGAMDYRDIRRQLGPELRLIGGIDLDTLRHGKEAIRREIEEKVPPLLAGGGYVPLADGRVREDVPFDNYVYYRELLQKVTQRCDFG
jgi:uroporphyrinogen decarboxylase-like protein